MKTETKLSEYLRMPCCKKCNWFPKPTIHCYESSVCPKCGSKLVTKVGRYEYTETKSWFSTTKTYNKFIKKDEESKP